MPSCRCTTNRRNVISIRRYGGQANGGGYVSLPWPVDRLDDLLGEIFIENFDWIQVNRSQVPRWDLVRGAAARLPPLTPFSLQVFSVNLSRSSLLFLTGTTMKT